MIMAFFATVWWIVGLRAAGHAPVLLYPVPIIVAAALGSVWYLTRSRGAAPTADDAAEEARGGRLVGWASAAEGIAIFIAANVLVNIGRSDAIAPVVAIIVGAHFIPFARGLPAQTYYVTAIALALLGTIGITITDLPTRLTVVSAGAASVLWLTAASALHRARGSGAKDRSPAPERRG